MTIQPMQLTYKISLNEGERLALPRELIDSIGAGEWLITVQPAPSPSEDDAVVRDHSAFLNSYVPEDDLLYADLASR